MIKIKRIIALLGGADLTPQTALEQAVKTVVAEIGKGGGVLTVDSTAGEGTLAMDITAGELYDAVAEGKTVVSEAALGEDSSVTFALNINAFALTDAGTTNYYFQTVNQAGVKFSAVELAADDTVTLTAAS